MVNSLLLERSGLQVTIESTESIPDHVVDQVSDTMVNIARLLVGPPKDLSQAETNLELFTLVTKLVRMGKNATTGGVDVAVKLAMDKDGNYKQLVQILTQNKRQDLQRAVDEERAQRKQQNETFVRPMSPLSPMSPPRPSSSSLPSPPASTTGTSSPVKLHTPKKRKSFETPTPDERPVKKPVAARNSMTSFSSATPPPRPTPVPFSHRTFPPKVVKSAIFHRLYRRFPISSYFQPPGMQSPCDLFKVPHPGGEYCPVNDRFDLYSPRFVQVIDSERVGLCPICIEPVERGGEGKHVWRPLSSPAYQNHMQLYHGISALTGKPFSPPMRVSVLSEGSRDNKTRRQEGKCHLCNQWIPLQDQQETGTDADDENLRESLWWAHAARCHLASNIEGETDIFEEDSIYIALRAKIEEVEQPLKNRQRSQRLQLQASASSSSVVTGTKGKKKHRRSSLKQEYNDAGYCYEYCPNRGAQMIMCEDKDCDTEWFHLKCVGLTAPPPGNWYCEKCKKQRTLTRAERGQRRAGYIRPEIVEKAKMLATHLADKKPGEEVVKI